MGGTAADWTPRACVGSGSRFAIHPGDELVAVAGVIRVVLLQVAGIPFRAEAEVERAAFCEKQTRVGGGVVEPPGSRRCGERSVDAIWSGRVGRTVAPASTLG